MRNIVQKMVVVTMFVNKISKPGDKKNMVTNTGEKMKMVTMTVNNIEQGEKQGACVDTNCEQDEDQAYDALKYDGSKQQEQKARHKIAARMQPR